MDSATQSSRMDVSKSLYEASRVAEDAAEHRALADAHRDQASLYGYRSAAAQTHRRQADIHDRLAARAAKAAR